jgi:hypothetical protein
MRMNIDASSVIELKPTTHRFFNELVTAQAAMAGYLAGHITEASGTGTAYGETGLIQQQCHTVPLELEVPAGKVLGTVVDQRWPQSVILRFHPGPAPAKTATLNGIQNLMGSLYQQAFIAYFERNRDAIEAKFDKVRNGKWPMVLQFGRAVRNAFAHGGTVDIREDITVTWRGVTYSPVENGRQVLYNDLSQGDLTILMVDMDESY